MTVVDVHCHVAPESCLPMEAVGPDGRTYGLRVDRDDCGAHCPVINGRPNRNCEADQLYDMERRLREMDVAGVDIQILSPVTFFYFYNLPDEECAARSRRVNTAVAAIVEGRPDRFRGMATLPMQNPELAVAERAVSELKLNGVEICSNVNGRNLDEPEFRPFFGTVTRLRVPARVRASRACRRRQPAATALFGKPDRQLARFGDPHRQPDIRRYPRRLSRHGHGFRAWRRRRLHPCRAMEPWSRRPTRVRRPCAEAGGMSSGSRRDYPRRADAVADMRGRTAARLYDI